jgi:hypothetical protein
MADLVQIVKQTGEISRVPRGVTPVIELFLEPHQYVANVELNERMFDHPDRKTVDWHWTAFVVTPLRDPAPDA